ncbi:hypothetical protein T265_07592 [Opisthorchis viverrini]|uniref:Uncharacterized protein n=1 Tax=Opisthorchis viverrini TaxID=6198 RepID=A0A074ZGS2_OPIVI|nr:hypothetical protein T265_07592 [Opisthorchis viverrini]KER24867.1 hypothetical protein T265_07592 [Opisthorchis viverrini]
MRPVVQQYQEVYENVYQRVPNISLTKNGSLFGGVKMLVARASLAVVEPSGKLDNCLLSTTEAIPSGSVGDTGSGFRFASLLSSVCDNKGEDSDGDLARRSLRASVNLMFYLKHQNREIQLGSRADDSTIIETDILGRRERIYCPPALEESVLAKREADDYVTFAGIVNRECEKFQLQSPTEDQFKCLIFVAGLQSSQESDIRTRVLSKLEHEKDITVKDLTTECQRLRNLKHDTAMVQQKSRSPISSSVMTLKRTTVTPGKKPPTSCTMVEPPRAPDKKE